MHHPSAKEHYEYDYDPIYDPLDRNDWDWDDVEDDPPFLLRRTADWLSSFFVNVTLLSGIGCTITLHDTVRYLIPIMLTGTILCLLHLLRVMTHPIPACRRKSAVRRRRLRSALQGCHAVMFLCSAAVMTILALYIYVPALRPPLTIATQLPPPAAEVSLKDYVETLSPLRTEVWDTLPLSQRGEVLEDVLSIEAKRLGLPFSLKLKLVQMDPDIVLGRYSHAQHQIHLNEMYFSDCTVQEALRVLTHECYHAYQHACVDIYLDLPEDAQQLSLFRDCAAYAYEFSNYVNGAEDLEGYAQQNVERSAESYSSSAAFDYLYALYEQEIFDHYD